LSGGLSGRHILRAVLKKDYNERKSKDDGTGVTKFRSKHNLLSGFFIWT
jgi:hypothetical protein